jgi:ERCC4-related helicase
MPVPLNASQLLKLSTYEKSFFISSPTFYNFGISNIEHKSKGGLFLKSKSKYFITIPIFENWENVLEALNVKLRRVTKIAMSKNCMQALANCKAYEVELADIQKELSALKDINLQGKNRQEAWKSFSVEDADNSIKETRLFTEAMGMGFILDRIDHLIKENKSSPQ